MIPVKSYQQSLWIKLHLFLEICASVCERFKGNFYKGQSITNKIHLFCIQWDLRTLILINEAVCMLGTTRVPQELFVIWVSLLLKLALFPISCKLWRHAHLYSMFAFTVTDNIKLINCCFAKKNCMQQQSHQFKVTLVNK